MKLDVLYLWRWKRMSAISQRTCLRPKSNFQVYAWPHPKWNKMCHQEYTSKAGVLWTNQNDAFKELTQGHQEYKCHKILWFTGSFISRFFSINEEGNWYWISILFYMVIIIRLNMVWVGCVSWWICSQMLSENNFMREVPSFQLSMGSSDRTHSLGLWS